LGKEAEGVREGALVETGLAEWNVFVGIGTVAAGGTAVCVGVGEDRQPVKTIARMTIVLAS
jgi:hypothetical protein